MDESRIQQFLRRVGKNNELFQIIIKKMDDFQNEMIGVKLDITALKQEVAGLKQRISQI